jgi:hypothetical protein
MAKTQDTKLDLLLGTLDMMVMRTLLSTNRRARYYCLTAAGRKRLTRDVLIEGVYRNEVEKLAAAAARFAETMSPLEALRAWMLLLVDYIAAKHIIAPALNTIAGGPSRLHEGSRTMIQGAIGELVKRAKKSGDLRRDLDAHDLLRALIGVSHVGSSADWPQSARRLVDILIAGSRPLK